MWKIPWFIILLTASSGEVVLIDNSVQIPRPGETSVQNRTIIIGNDSTLIIGGNRNASSGDDTRENTAPQGDVIVTGHGPVRGYQATVSKIWQFFDIPYGAFDAEDPFQEPGKPEPWSAVREIKGHSSHCPQMDSENTYTGNIDCLTLSVFVPSGANNADVLFHIHDGGFIRGSGDPRFYGPDYLVSKNVILVLPNYRLGPLGFLCLQNETAPGNAALKDLTLALNWTKENIEAFGGNSSNIVVSGSNTGAALAEYLALSSKSQDYFSKVITESGCVLSYWALDRNPSIIAEKLAKRLQTIEAENAKRDIYRAFDEVSVEKLVKAAKGLVFRPCVETVGGFITETPWNLLHQKMRKSFMVGAADSPGMIKAMMHTEESVSALNDDFGLLVPNDLTFEESNGKVETGKRIKVQYFGNETITLDHLNELALCYTDCSYLSPGIRNARLLVGAENNVYLYEFSYVGNGNNAAEHRSAEDMRGTLAGDSLNYVFKREDFAPAQGSEEQRMIDLMTDLWVSFIQTGIPSSENVDWEEFVDTNEEKEEWLSIDSTTETKKGFHTDRLNLWTEIYNEHFVDNNLANRQRLYPFFTYLALLIGLFTNAYA